jgi:hypothetical protein
MRKHQERTGQQGEYENAPEIRHNVANMTI